jgi:hypothetical protein
MLFLLVLAVCGCGGTKARPGGTVTGTVTYKGEAVPAGTVTFYGADPNDVAVASLATDGTFTATGVPFGKVTVTVTTPPPSSALEKAAKSSPRGKRFGVGKEIVATAKVVSIPVKYSKPAQSELSLNVKEGSQPYDINLK